MVTNILKKAFFSYFFAFLPLNMYANSGTLTIINNTSTPIEILGKKQIGLEQPISEEFGRDITIARNVSLNLGDFAFLLDLKVRKPSDEKCYQALQLPTYEEQKGHAGDNLTITITLKKVPWYSWAKDQFIVSYRWTRKAPQGQTTTTKKLKRPFWTDITNLKRAEVEGHLAPYLRRVYYFSKGNGSPTQEQLLGAPRKVLFSIHGTFARDSKEFYDPDDKTFENILAYAESLGESVEVVALKWTGKNDANARVAAGQFLAGLINDHYKNKQTYTSLNTISHSHGGNVVNVATHFTPRPFETIVSLYTPIRTDFEWFTPNTANLKTLYQFYSTSDHIQFIGAINVFKLNVRNIFSDWGARKALTQNTEPLETKGKIYNIRVEFSGISPAHVNKEAIVAYLPMLLWYINNTYKINYDLDADIDPKSKEILVSIRHSVSRPIIKSKIASPAMREQAQKEEDASRKSAAKYLIKYQKQMGKKGWRVINLLRSGKQTILGN